jgi:hypothetical protein
VRGQNSDIVQCGAHLSEWLMYNKWTMMMKTFGKVQKDERKKNCDRSIDVVQELFL